MVTDIKINEAIIGIDDEGQCEQSNTGLNSVCLQTGYGEVFDIYWLYTDETTDRTLVAASACRRLLYCYTRRTMKRVLHHFG